MVPVLKSSPMVVTPGPAKIVQPAPAVIPVVLHYSTADPLG